MCAVSRSKSDPYPRTNLSRQKLDTGSRIRLSDAAGNYTAIMKQMTAIHIVRECILKTKFSLTLIEATAI
jgi:hypothetical protein